MKQTLTQSMAWLHTWGGLIVGWLLFAIFLTGSLAVFDQEISNWMQPEIQDHGVSQTQATRTGLNWLQANHPDARVWTLNLPTERSPELSVSAAEGRRGKTTTLDTLSGEVITPRDTTSGYFFFGFHFTLHIPGNLGIYLVGMMAIGMLVALVSGIIIHKKIFKEFFTFRPEKGQRSWLDAHNASAVLLLPFHLMISYTGLVIFLVLYMPAAVDVLFKGDSQAYYKTQFGNRFEQPRPTDAPPAPLTDLAPLLARATEVMGPVSSVSIRNPGRSDAQVSVRPVLGNRIELTKGKSMSFDGVTGAVLQMPTQKPTSVFIQSVMSGLHFAQFGGYPMRWMYFICGLLSSAMIASGLVLFTVKRRRNYARHGRVEQGLYRGIEALNVAVVAGLCVACIGLLWCNRLLPLDLPGRADREEFGFFALWLGSLLHALLRPRLLAWREQLGLAAVLCLGLPLLNLATADYPWSVHSRLVLDLTAMILGGLLAFAAWQTTRTPTPRPARNRVTAQAPAQDKEQAAC